MYFIFDVLLKFYSPPVTPIPLYLKCVYLFPHWQIVDGITFVINMEEVKISLY
jgi:hypothetical protein